MSSHMVWLISPEWDFNELQEKPPALYVFSISIRNIGLGLRQNKAVLWRTLWVIAFLYKREGLTWMYAEYSEGSWPAICRTVFPFEAVEPHRTVQWHVLASHCCQTCSEGKSAARHAGPTILCEGKGLYCVYWFLSSYEKQRRKTWALSCSN